MTGRIKSISLFSLPVYFLIIILVSCKDEYKPHILSSSPSYLVVEGVLNIGGPTSIRISRTSRVYDRGIISERGANVTVEGKDNITRQLLTNGNGIYISPDLGLNIGAEYRLRIRTSGGKEYLSHYITARETPAIDSITWKQDDDGLHILVSTHDVTDNTRYYRWEYDETWEIRSFYVSSWKYIPDTNIVRPRLPWEDVSVGWKYDSSKNILLGSSASLQSDIIFRAPLILIPSNHEKLSVRYSILVRQYALDKPGYAFYELMEKNTESLGTIFDAQPSETIGNIICVNDPEEPVIGYLTATTIPEVRIFISNHELTGWRFKQDCPTFDIVNHPDSLRNFFRGGYQPIDYRGGATYLSSYGRCVDVTIREASLVKPSYW